MKHGTSAYSDGCRCEVCKDAYREYHRAYRRRPGRGGTERHLRENYRMSVDDVLALISAQGGRCPICDGDLEPYGRKGGRTHVDHDHATGKVRGVLCHQCNQGLGKFRDSAEHLDRAARYLRGSHA